MKRNLTLTASTPKKSTASKRIVIVALSALACLTGIVAQARMSADSGREASSLNSGRTTGKLAKTSHKKKQKATVTTARVRPKHKPKPVATTFQNRQDELDGADGQDGVENQDWEQNVEGCEYDETNDEYWCDEDTEPSQPIQDTQPSESTEEKTTTTSEGVYKISGDNVDTSGATPATAKAIIAAWKHFAKLIPAERRTMISTFSLIDKSEQGYDGQVERVDDKNDRWELRLKPGTDADDFVVVHELAHLLTLSQQQLDQRVPERKCAPYRFWEGCPRPNSFSDQFVRRFWTADLVRQAEADYKRVDRRHVGWFVRDYSATNPGEDMADTFAEFVTNANEPTGNRIVDQKINMFWADPDMMFLRAQIRANGKF